MRSPGVLLLVGVLALAGCRSPFTNVWEDTDWKGAPLQNVLVVGKEVDAVTRRDYEDAMVARLQEAGVAAAPSYRAVPDAITPDGIARAIAAGGHDGLIAARLIGVDERVRYMPSAQRAQMGPGRHGWRTWDGFAPGTWSVDRVARIETQVWSLSGEGTMIWAGSSDSVNPRDLSSVFRRLADRTVTTLQQVGILKPK